jgi:tRNA nucleotidyltransferase (CCA-adding enzyme)
LDATLREFSSFNRRKVIDIEKYYANRAREIDLLFKESLVVIDPVDKVRNVASAVQPQKLHTLVAAARAFLKSPDRVFFFPPRSKALSPSELACVLENHGSPIVLLAIGQVDAVPDVLWGQLYKTRRCLRRLLELGDFTVFRDEVWSDEKSLSVFLFELDQSVLSEVKLHLGPPLERETECEDFLAKYVANVEVVSGPYIAEGRWVVELRRKFRNIEFLNAKLEEGGENVGVAKLVSKALANGYEILSGGQVARFCEKNRELAVFVTEFLVGRPFWLKKSINGQGASVKPTSKA